MSLLSHIHFKNVSLAYELYFEKTSGFKEYLINKINRRRYVEEKSRELLALQNINLSFSEGERIGIIGLNGSGKSTLLKVIAGILKPTRGLVDVTGTIQSMIEVNAGFNPEFSGRENIYFNGYMLGFTKKEIKDREKDIIEFSELGKFIDVPVKYYSSGMSVRLSFSMATCINPEILLFDEMLSAGDASFINKATNRMDELVGKAKIIILVSHDLGLIEKMCRRVLVLEKGQIAFDGPTKTALDFYLAKVNQTSQIEHREML